MSLFVAALPLQLAQLFLEILKVFQVRLQSVDKCLSRVFEVVNDHVHEELDLGLAMLFVCKFFLQAGDLLIFLGGRLC